MTLTPMDEAEVADMLRSTDAPLRPRGGGTRDLFVADPAPALFTAALTGITLYDPAALTIVPRAGTPLAQVQETLAAQGQRLPFEPPDLRAVLGRKGASTIGGVVAANASGPRRVQAGACRDSLIGVRFVTGAGEVVANGGRVMKNVTGYDLVKLIAGSHGMLGVLTEVAFKLLPAPEMAATLSLHGLPPDRAVAAMAAALGSPYDVTGAAYAGGAVHIRIEGFAPSVAYRREKLAAVLAPFGTVADGGDPWPSIRDVAGLARLEGDLWRIHCKPSDAPAIVERVEPLAYQLDWGGGLIWARFQAGRDIRAGLMAFAGHATRMVGDPADGIATLPPESPVIATLTRGLRARFDPRGILQPKAA